MISQREIVSHPRSAAEIWTGATRVTFRITLALLGMFTLSTLIPAFAAPFSFTSVLGGGPQPGMATEALTPGALPGGVTLSITADPGGAPGGIVSGGSGYYSPPYVAAGTPVSGPYYSTSLGSIAFGFATPRYDLGLLWGSVDASNALSFYDGTALIGTILGSDVLASPNGAQSFAGGRYVSVDAGAGFDRVLATSGQISFEFANVVAGPAAIPEPVSVALMIAGLAIMGGAATYRRVRA